MQYALQSFGEVGWTAFRAHSDSLLNAGFRSCSSRWSAVGVHRTLLRRLLGGWAFALAFRREVFASLDMAYTNLPPSRRCRLSGALLDELLLITKLAPLLETNSRAEPCEKLYAADASPSGAGGCFASISREDWLALCELAEEKCQHVDWKGEEPPSSMRDARAATAPLALKLNWTTLFFLPFLRRQAYQSLGTGEPDQPPQAHYTQGGSWYLWTRAWPCELSKSDDRAHDKSISCFENRVFGVSLMTLHWSWYGCPPGRIRWRPLHGLKVGIPHCQSFLRHRLDSLHQPTFSRSWIYSVNHCRLLPTQRENMCRELESSGAFRCSKAKSAHVENETSQVTHAESNSTPSNMRQLLRKGVKSMSKDEKAERAADCSLTPRWPRCDPIFITPSWFRAPPGFRSAFGVRTGRTIGETNYCIEEVTSKHTPDLNAHLLCENGTSCHRAWCPLLRHAMTWPCQDSSEIASAMVSPILNTQI